MKMSLQFNDERKYIMILKGKKWTNEEDEQSYRKWKP